jgi:hypothetical protein
VLAIAKTGSGKTLGFLLPVLARCVRDRSAAAAATGSNVGGGKGGGGKGSSGNGGGWKGSSGSSSYPQCLIMAPTRELAVQIASEAQKFGAAVGCSAVCVYGGASRSGQVAQLSRGCDVIVGTPGRVMDVLDVRGQGAEACVSVDRCGVKQENRALRAHSPCFQLCYSAARHNSKEGKKEGATCYLDHRSKLDSATRTCDVPMRGSADLLR